MRRMIGLAVAIGLMGSTVSSRAIAQNQPSADQVQTMYQDALNQLKAAQDRKNELATENAKLKKHEADLQQQLAASNRRVTSLKQQLTQSSDFSTAWAEFVNLYPPLRSLWTNYVSVRQLPPGITGWLDDASWPFMIDG